MRKSYFVLPFVALFGCGDSTSMDMAGGDMAKPGGGDMAMATGDMAMGPDMAMGGLPAPPALGATVMDRMGRPGINTALTDPFGLCMGDKAGLCDKVGQKGKTTDQVKDAYNNAPVADWMKWAAPMFQNLAILDSLDTKCGNQAGFGAVAPAYGTIAGALSDDQLFLNPDNKESKWYLAVEVNTLTLAAGGMPPFPNDCGGRSPLADAIDVTYSLLAAGVPAGVGDGVMADGDNGAHKLDVFPFLADPM